MTRVFRMVRTLAVAALVCGGAALRVDAAPIVTIDPVSQQVNVGEIATVDIVVSGLTEPTGGFFILLGFDPVILEGLSFVNDPTGSLGPSSLDLSGGFGPNMFADEGELDLFLSADEEWDAAMLEGAQGDSFLLATLAFTATANGVSPVILLAAELSDADGLGLLQSSSQNGQICVGTAPCPVPEPALFALFATGLTTLVAARRRRRA